MIMFYCDECGKKMHRSSPGVPHITPVNTVVWGAPGRVGEYHFCSAECRREGAQKLIASDWTGAELYECDRELARAEH